MPKQTARKCTGGGFAPYLLQRARKAAAAGAGGANNDIDGSNHADGAGEGDDASRDLSVSSAGVEDMKLFTAEELQGKTKEELIQIVIRLQDSIQDIIAEEDDEDDEYGGVGGGGGGGGDEDDDEDDEDDDDFDEGVIRADGAGDRDVVELDEEEDDEEDDDLDDDEDDEGANGVAVNGDGAAAADDADDGQSKD